MAGERNSGEGGKMEGKQKEGRVFARPAHVHTLDSGALQSPV